MKLIRRCLFGQFLAIMAAGNIQAATIQYISSSTAKPADDVVWFGPSLAYNSNATISTSASYTSNFGVAFKTGSSGPYAIDWVRLDLNSSSVIAGSSSLKIAIHAATNDIAYSAVASSTALATDSISFTMPTTANTNFSLYLKAADVPNIAAYEMAGTTAYTLILYNAGSSIGLQRTTGLANGTTNNNYTVNDGFVALDTFRNNIANYSNTSSSYPTLGISFGTSVPEPSSFLLTSVLGCISLCARRKRH